MLPCGWPRGSHDVAFRNASVCVCRTFDDPQRAGQHSLHVDRRVLSCGRELQMMRVVQRWCFFLALYVCMIGCSLRCAEGRLQASERSRGNHKRRYVSSGSNDCHSETSCTLEGSFGTSADSSIFASHQARSHLARPGNELVWVYSLITTDYDGPNLAPHFLSHYLALGIPASRMYADLLHDPTLPDTGLLFVKQMFEDAGAFTRVVSQPYTPSLQDQVMISGLAR